jgi:hypothetical protein
MLPAYIIEKLLEYEKKKESMEEICIEYPEDDMPSKSHPRRPGREPTDEGDRGVAIIDFSI